MSLLTSDQVAKMAGVSTSYVQILRRTGAIIAASAEKATRQHGGHGTVYRFDPSAVDVARAAKASARARQRVGGLHGVETKLATCNGRKRLCMKRPMDDGTARPCVIFDLGCGPCLKHYSSTPGIAGQGTVTYALASVGGR